MISYWKNKHVLVTGASGFIGSRIVSFLTNNDIHVTACSSYQSKEKKLQNVNQKYLTSKHANLLNEKECIDLIKGHDIVLNFAAMDGSAAFKSEHCAEIFYTNNQIVCNLLEAARRQKVKKVLLMSSTEVYDPHLVGVIKENAALVEKVENKILGYGLSKKANEIAAKLYYMQYGLPILIVRAGNIYGPGDYLSEERSRVIPTFIKRVASNQQVTIYGNGLQKRSFLYIDDFISALMLLVEKHTSPDPVNVVGSHQLSMKKLAQTIISLLEKKQKILYKDKEKIDIKKNQRSISNKKLKRIIGEFEQTSLIEGLHKTIIDINNRLN